MSARVLAVVLAMIWAARGRASTSTRRPWKAFFASAARSAGVPLAKVCQSSWIFPAASSVPSTATGLAMSQSEATTWSTFGAAWLTAAEAP